MNTENLITWNVTNWVTIVLMTFVGFLVLALVAQGGKRLMQRKAS